MNMASEVSSLRSPTRSKSRQWDANAVGSDDYLVSITRRLEILEKRLVGKHGLDQEDQPPLTPILKVKSCFLFFI